MMNTLDRELSGRATQITQPRGGRPRGPGGPPGGLGNMRLGQQQGRVQDPTSPHDQDNHAPGNGGDQDDQNPQYRDFAPPFGGFGRPPIPPNMPLYSPDGTRVNERQPPAVDARLIIQTAKTRQESYMTFGDHCSITIQNSFNSFNSIIIK